MVTKAARIAQTRAAGKRWYDKNGRRYHAAPERREKARLARQSPVYKAYMQAYSKVWSAVPANRAGVLARKRKYNGMPEPTRPCPSLCECCGGLPNGNGALHLDHDHETGAFRGWLCARCNLGIGALGDTALSVRRALKYLMRKNKQ